MFEKVVLGLGGNIPSMFGDPKTTIERSIEDMSQSGLDIRDVGRFFSTPCFPAGAGPNFVNSAILCRTNATPEELLKLLNKIEMKYGRTRSERWAARTLDIDILAIDDLILPDAAEFDGWQQLPTEQQKTNTPSQLIIPHPRIQDRAFVLIPLHDVAADWRHPVSGLTVSEMISALPASEIAAVKPI